MRTLRPLQSVRVSAFVSVYEREEEEGLCENEDSDPSPPEKKIQIGRR